MGGRGEGERGRRLEAVIGEFKVNNVDGDDRYGICTFIHTSAIRINQKSVYCDVLHRSVQFMDILLFSPWFERPPLSLLLLQALNSD